jgi:hypothetical protein
MSGETTWGMLFILLFGVVPLLGALGSLLRAGYERLTGRCLDCHGRLVEGLCAWCRFLDRTP